MTATTTNYYSLGYANAKTYFLASVFILGNLLLPQLCHLIPSGGLILLPIYFFTLTAAYKYGLWVGLLTAVFSPLVNHWLFGMPAETVLPVILSKSVLLAVAAALTARRLRSLSVLALLGVVLSYQVAGTLVEWALVKNLAVALQDFRIGLPGMIIQVLGGYLVLRSIARF